MSEQSVGFDSDESRFVGVESPACVVRLGIPVEFSGFFERTLTGPDWRPRAAQAKVVPYNTDQLAIGLSPGALRDITVRRNVFIANVRVTFKFGKEFRIHTNLGYLYDGRTDISYVTGGVGFDWDFVDKFSLMGGDLPQGRSSGISAVTEPRTQIGLQYSPLYRRYPCDLWAKHHRA